MKPNVNRLLLLVLCVLSLSRSTSAQNSAECTITPPTSGSVVAGTQFTIGWCDTALDVNGNPTTITGFRVYRNNAIVNGLTVVTDGPTSNNVRYSHAASSEPAAGTFTYTVSALNAQGESAKSVTFTLTVTPPLGVPATPTILRVTVP